MQSKEEKYENLKRKCQEIEKFQESLQIQKQNTYYQFENEQNKLTHFQNYFTPASLQKARTKISQTHDNINQQIQEIYYKMEIKKEEIQKEMKDLRRQ